MPYSRRTISAKVESTHVIELDYALPLKEMITSGKYDEVKTTDGFHPYWTLKMFGTGKSVRELILVRFAGSVTTEEMHVGLRGLNLRSALTEELLALGAKEPELQRQDWIVSLGSSMGDSWGGGECASCLYGKESRREFMLFWPGFVTDWPAKCLFAAVRREPA